MNRDDFDVLRPGSAFEYRGAEYVMLEMPCWRFRRDARGDYEHVKVEVGDGVWKWLEVRFADEKPELTFERNPGPEPGAAYRVLLGGMLIGWAWLPTRSATRAAGETHSWRYAPITGRGCEWPEAFDERWTALRVCESSRDEAGERLARRLRGRKP